MRESLLVSNISGNRPLRTIRSYAARSGKRTFNPGND
jgi:hypothetical protein